MGSGVGSSFYFLCSPGYDFRPRGLWAKEKPVAGRVEARNRGLQICAGARTIASCLVGSWSPPLRSPNSPADDPLEAKGLLFWLWKEQRGATGKIVCLQRAGWRAEKPGGQSGGSHTRGEREGAEALGPGRRDGAWLGFVQERRVVPGGDSRLPAAEPEGLGAGSSRKFRYQPLALPSKWGFFPSVITDVSCPCNCVLYFRGGASRGDWKPRSNPSSLAQHPSHTQGPGRSEGSRKSGVLTGSQKKGGNFVCSQNPPQPSIFRRYTLRGPGPAQGEQDPVSRGPEITGARPIHSRIHWPAFLEHPLHPGTLLGWSDVAVNGIEGGAGILKEALRHKALPMYRTSQSSPATLPCGAVGQAPPQNGPGTASRPPSTPQPPLS